MQIALASPLLGLAATRAFALPGATQASPSSRPSANLQSGTAGNADAGIALQRMAAGKEQWIGVRNFGAVGDGLADDAASINRAMAAGSGKIVHFGAGKYLVNDPIDVRSNTTVVFDPGVIVICGSDRAKFLQISEKENVNIFGNGALVTKSRAKPGPSVIYVLGSSNVHLDSIVIDGSGKDGIYVGPGRNNTQNLNTRITNCTIGNCRRQGISVTHAKSTLIQNCDIFGTSGESPAAGIDLEANPDTTVEDTVIRDCHIHDNLQQGGIAHFMAVRTIIDGCKLENNLVAVNIDTTGIHIVHKAVASVDGATGRIVVPAHDWKVGDMVRFRKMPGGALPAGVASNSSVFFVLSVINADTVVLSTNYNGDPFHPGNAGVLPLQMGRYLENDNCDITISNCIISGGASGGGGIYAEQGARVTCIGNTISHAYGGINLVNTPDCTITGNTINPNLGGRAIYLTSRNCIVSNNRIFHSRDKGIEISGTEKSVVSNNVLIACGSVSSIAVFLKYATDCIVSNNTLVPDPSIPVAYGIVLDGMQRTARNLVAQNNLKGFGKDNAHALVIVPSANFDGGNVNHDGTFTRPDLTKQVNRPN